MVNKEETGQRAHHLIDTEFAARELRCLGEKELGYLAEVMRGETLSNYISESSMTRRFEDAFAKRVGVKKAMAKNAAMSGLVEAVSVSGAGPGFEVICDPIVHFGGLAAIAFNAVPRFPERQAGHVQHGPRIAPGEYHPTDEGGDRDAHVGAECGDRDHP